MRNSKLTYRICLKKLNRGPMVTSRVFIQWKDGKQKWRTYLPFFVNSSTSKEAQFMINNAKTVALRQMKDYQRCDRIYQDLQPKEHSDVTQIAPD